MEVSSLKQTLWSGAVAGLLGGLVFGSTMIELGMLPTIAGLVRAESPVVGFIVHMGVATLIGMGFSLLVRYQRPWIAETLFWGTAYGVFWWFLGPLTLLPIFLGKDLAWQAAQAREAFPSLLGHILYGATTGFALLFFQRLGGISEAPSMRAGMLIRGALGGLLGAWLLGSALAAQGLPFALVDYHQGESNPLFWSELFASGLTVGISFALLYPSPSHRAGVSLIRGSMYGFLWWILLMLTIVPLFRGAGLSWSLPEVHNSFHTLPGFLLMGAAVALTYRFLDGLVRVLFSDEVGNHTPEGVGPLGLRVIMRGSLGGLIGGLLFTVVMIQLDILPAVASLVGATSLLAGFLVHLVIASLIGVSYGFLFRQESHDFGSALAWGASYGFFWWLLGPLTLMPIFLGDVPQWSVWAAVEGFGSLVGHLIYGAGLGAAFYWLESRYNPWWVPRSRVQVERIARYDTNVLTSAPALWVQVIVLALTVLLGH
jgi:uncharacterized membrane protein YagU involved in acid resistance